MRTRCAICRRIEDVTLSSYVEPAGPEVSQLNPDEPVSITAALCDDCHVVHWASTLTHEPSQATLDARLVDALADLTPEEVSRLVPERPILVAYRGSHSHGTYVPPEAEDGHDDVDLITAYIPGLARYFGTEGTTWAGKDVKIGKWDGVAYELRHLVSLLEHCNPNVISALWLRHEDYLHLSSEGETLIANRDLFSSRLAAKSFGGYAFSQLKRATAWHDQASAGCRCEGQFHEPDCGLKAERGRGSSKLYATGFMGAKRKSLVEKHGYDTKNAAHLVRLLRMGIEFLRFGELRVWRDDRDELLSIKRGDWSLDRVKREADTLFAELPAAEAESPLPEKPDFSAINDLVVSMLAGAHQAEILSRAHRR